MNPPVRATIVYGMLSAVSAMPLTGMLAAPLGRMTAFKLTIWAILAGYTLLLARMRSQRPAVLLFPMALLFGIALWPGMHSGFFFILLGVLAWIRSGIFFAHAPFRAAIAETLVLAGGTGLVALLEPAGPLAWTLAIWLFILIQCLYYFIVPMPSIGREQGTRADPFTTACREVQRILDG